MSSYTNTGYTDTEALEKIQKIVAEHYSAKWLFEVIEQNALRLTVYRNPFLNLWFVIIRSAETDAAEYFEFRGTGNTIDEAFVNLKQDAI